jgi:carbon monoxide dehydrogenase subunit G
VKISGDATLHAPIERVWLTLRDPAVLARTIPGCESLEATGPGTYLITVTASVASTAGTYSGTVRVHDSQQPSSFAMSASGAGAPGTVDSDVRVRLSEVDGSTLLHYDADAVVGGVIGGVGQRMLTSVLRRSAGEFFAAVDDVLTGKAATADAVAETRDGFAASAPPAGAGFRRGATVGVAIALAGFAAGAVWGRRGS